MVRSRELKRDIIQAGEEAVKELIKVAKESIFKEESCGGSAEDDDNSYELAADRLKNAAASKKVAIFDAFEILNRIQLEEEALEAEIEAENNPEIVKVDEKKGFAERHSK